jgi:glycosyltransferase involved in cell wall biosynthesis
VPLPAPLSKAYSFVLEAVFDAIPASARGRAPTPLRKLARRILNRRTIVEPMMERLWGGFSTSAIAELEAVVDDIESPHRSRALVTLALWHGAFGDAEKAAQLLEVQAALDPVSAANPRYYLPRVYYLCLLGRAEEARGVLSGLGKVTLDDSLALAWASTYSPTAAGAAADPDKALEWLNRVFTAHGLAKVRRRHADRPLSLDNLVGVDVPAPPNQTALVSVIVPAYNAADMIGTALQSLAEQSWRNLEIVVVDDASTDGTADVAERFCATDARFRVIRRTVNAGSYTCRNAALPELRGDYITTLDGDDWAHPQRIALHVADLERHGAAFNVSNWVRATDDLLFSGASRPAAVTPLRNMGSFFFKRAVMEKIGGWHEVRIAADTEYMKRAELVFRTLTRGPIKDGVPLVLGRLVATSLTQSSATSVATLSHGVRREYHELVDFFHSRHRAGRTSLDELRSWPARGAPPAILPVRGQLAADALLVGDWNNDLGFTQGKELADSLRQAGKRVAMLHYPHYASEVRNELGHRVRDYAWANDLSFVTAGEQAKVDAVYVITPDVFEHPLDRFPMLAFGELIITADPSAVSEAVKANIVSSFGRDGRWTSTDTPV